MAGAWRDLHHSSLLHPPALYGACKVLAIKAFPSSIFTQFASAHGLHQPSAHTSALNPVTAILLQSSVQHEGDGRQHGQQASLTVPYCI